MNITTSAASAADFLLCYSVIMNMLKKSFIIAGFAIITTIIAAAPTFATIEECLENYPGLSTEYNDKYPIRCPKVLINGEYVSLYADKSASCAQASTFAADYDAGCAGQTTKEDEEPKEGVVEGEEDADVPGIEKIPASEAIERLQKESAEEAASANWTLFLFMGLFLLIFVASIVIRVMRIKKFVTGVKDAVQDYQGKKESEQNAFVDAEKPAVNPNNPFLNNGPIQPAVPTDPIGPAQPATPAATEAPAQPAIPAQPATPAQPEAQLADPGLPNQQPGQPNSLQ